MDFSNVFLSAQGRIDRRTFWIGYLILAVFNVIVSLFAAALFGQMTFTTRLIYFLYILVMAYPAYAVAAKRFQDRGKNGALGAILVGISIFSSLLTLFKLNGEIGAPNMLGVIVGVATLPIVVWYLIELGILRGTVGDNRYGPDPVVD
jgi:uncharacterized membrane protein YhaH (DUF805 family)